MGHDFLSSDLFALIVSIGVTGTVFMNLRKAYGFISIPWAVSALSKNLTDEGAEKFCRFVEDAIIPNNQGLYDNLRAGWSMVRDSIDISRDMKVKVKAALQGRGVYVR